MRLTQGMYSFLPDLSDDQIARQVDYFAGRGWAVSLEYTDDPHPRNTYWEMFGQPIFDLLGPEPVMDRLADCRLAHPGVYIRLSAFESVRGYESVRASMIVQRPDDEPRFFVERSYGPGRNVHYATRRTAG